MKRLMAGGLLIAAFGTVLTIANPAPASAQLARVQSLSDGTQDLVTSVQYRRGGRGGYHHHYHGGRGRGYGGAAAGLGIGLAAGAILGGAIAAQSAPRYYEPAPAGDAVGYCMSRFKSYDPESGTYLGYDGLRHPCP
jgi:hypothetical protein